MKIVSSNQCIPSTPAECRRLYHSLFRYGSHWPLLQPVRICPITVPCKGTLTSKHDCRVHTLSAYPCISPAQLVLCWTKQQLLCSAGCRAQGQAANDRSQKPANLTLIQQQQHQQWGGHTTSTVLSAPRYLCSCAAACSTVGALSVCQPGTAELQALLARWATLRTRAAASYRWSCTQMPSQQTLSQSP